MKTRTSHNPTTRDTEVPAADQPPAVSQVSLINCPLASRGLVAEDNSTSHVSASDKAVQQLAPQRRRRIPKFSIKPFFNTGAELSCAGPSTV